MDMSKPMSSALGSLVRVQHQLAYVLHTYDWSESSVIVELWTLDYGRVAVVAKGAKKPSSYLRSVLLPLQRLSVSWRGEEELRTLTRCEWSGGTIMPQGDALIAGLYLNELLLKLMAREEASTSLFDAYDQVVKQLHDSAKRLAWIRGFELLLLKELGVLPALNHLAHTCEPLQETQRYDLSLEGWVLDKEEQGVMGSTGLLLHHFLHESQENKASFWLLMQSCEPALRLCLRELLHYHSGQLSFKTRGLMDDMRDMAFYLRSHL